MNTAIFWFRKDLRLHDNAALYNATKNHEKVIAVFIYDETLHDFGSASKWWLHHSLKELQKQISFVLYKGSSKQILLKLAQDNNISHIYWNSVFEPHALKYEQELKNDLAKHNIICQIYNSSLLFLPNEIKNSQGISFGVFTHFWKKCLSSNKEQLTLPLPQINKIIHLPNKIELNDLDLLPTKPNWAKGFYEYFSPGENNALQRFDSFISSKLFNYSNGRDIPSSSCTSKLSPYIHFGEISVRYIYNKLRLLYPINNKDYHQAEKFLSEIGWREFSYHLLCNNPRIIEKSFRSEFESFKWENDDRNLKKWQKGLTGFPIVDAGMRELWHTGYMHNRVRMIVGSFLVKDLFIHWKHGADWFFDCLLDADLANNICSWQWVAGCGADAAPYFRIFNPTLQGEKFDANGEYVKRWIPELSNLPSSYIHKPWLAPKDILKNSGITLGLNYPEPIVNHDIVRKIAMEKYKKLKQS
jgi:deoxyribodipyrimidine photo-lyase